MPDKGRSMSYICTYIKPHIIYIVENQFDHHPMIRQVPLSELLWPVWCPSQQHPEYTRACAQTIVDFQDIGCSLSQCTIRSVKEIRRYLGGQPNSGGALELVRQ